LYLLGTKLHSHEKISVSCGACWRSRRRYFCQPEHDKEKSETGKENGKAGKEKRLQTLLSVQLMKQKQSPLIFDQRAFNKRKFIPLNFL
jgi:hypothetical protein